MGTLLCSICIDILCLLACYDVTMRTIAIICLKVNPLSKILDPQLQMISLMSQLGIYANSTSSKLGSLRFQSGSTVYILTSEYIYDTWEVECFFTIFCGSFVPGYVYKSSATLSSRCPCIVLHPQLHFTQ